MILIPSDFQGVFKIGQSSDLQAFIDKYEPMYLMNLLGIDLYLEFKDDFDKVKREPKEEIYKEIFKPILDEKYGYSEGIKEMLRGFIFFEYVRVNKFKVTESGVHVSRSDSTREPGFTEFNIYNYYNGSIKSYKVIRKYLIDNSEVYPKFNGVDKQIAHWAL
jgi:hypothetical protein